jgi:hypothetical protein
MADSPRRHAKTESEILLAARMGRHGSVIAAAVAAVGVIAASIVTVMSKDSSPQANPAPSPAQTSAAVPAQAPALPSGTIDEVAVSPDGTHVTVKGRTTAEIVAVLVGPRPGSKDGYWASGETVARPSMATGNAAAIVREVAWDVVVNTDPRVSNQYTVEAFYDSPPPEAPVLAPDQGPATAPGPGAFAGPRGIGAVPPPPVGWAPRAPRPIEAVPVFPAPAPGMPPAAAPVPVFPGSPRVVVSPPVTPEVQSTIDGVVWCKGICESPHATFHGTFGPA